MTVVQTGVYLVADNILKKNAVTLFTDKNRQEPTRTDKSRQEPTRGIFMHFFD